MLRYLVLGLGFASALACSTGEGARVVVGADEASGYPGSSYGPMPRGESQPSSDGYPGGGGACQRLCDVVLACFAPDQAAQLRGSCAERCRALGCSAAALEAVACLLEQGFVCEDGELKLVNPYACEAPREEVEACGLFEDGGPEPDQCASITQPCARCLCETEGDVEACVEACQDAQ